MVNTSFKNRKWYQAEISTSTPGKNAITVSYITDGELIKMIGNP
jgi:hypothetical protein